MFELEKLGELLIGGLLVIRVPRFELTHLASKGTGMIISVYRAQFGVVSGNNLLYDMFQVLYLNDL